MLLESGDYVRTNIFRKWTLASDLKYAGAAGVGERQDRSEIQIVCEYSMIIRLSPFHDFRILGSRITPCGPMIGDPAMARQYIDPLHR